MSEELTEKEILENSIVFLEHVLKHGTHSEIQKVNVCVSSNIMHVEEIMRKYWPDIVANNSIITGR